MPLRFAILPVAVFTTVLLGSAVLASEEFSGARFAEEIASITGPTKGGVEVDAETASLPWASIPIEPTKVTDAATMVFRSHAPKKHHLRFLLDSTQWQDSPPLAVLISRLEAAAATTELLEVEAHAIGFGGLLLTGAGHAEEARRRLDALLDRVEAAAYPPAMTVATYYRLAVGRISNEEWRYSDFNRFPGTEFLNRCTRMLTKHPDALHEWVEEELLGAEWGWPSSGLRHEGQSVAGRVFDGGYATMDKRLLLEYFNFIGAAPLDATAQLQASTVLSDSERLEFLSHELQTLINSDPCFDRKEDRQAAFLEEALSDERPPRDLLLAANTFGRLRIPQELTQPIVSNLAWAALYRTDDRVATSTALEECALDYASIMEFAVRRGFHDLAQEARFRLSTFDDGDLSPWVRTSLKRTQPGRFELERRGLQ